MEDCRFEVKMALEEHRRGNDGLYDTLKEHFANDKQRYLPPVIGEDEDTLKPQDLRAYVVALIGNIHLLKQKECNGLVKQVLQCSWLGRDEAFQRTFTHFLAALISAQGSYLVPVLTMIIDKFTYTRPTSWRVTDFPEITRETMRERLHLTVQHIIQMFPAAKQMLGDLLAERFPFPDENLRIHMAYIDNLFRVKAYISDLEQEILDLTLNRVVKIDAQMQLDLEDLDDDITAAAMYALREQPRETSQWEDDDDDESDTDSIASDDPDFDVGAARVKGVKESVEKMDALLDLLFEYYTPHIAPTPGSDKAYETFTGCILRGFEYMVLPTYKSRHTQFLVFHFAQMDQRLSEAFTGQMIALAGSTRTPGILQQASLAYLASFVARGAHVSRDIVREVFGLLLHYMKQYHEKWEHTCRGPDLKRFHRFYSLVQAAMYIFCFRWQDLVESAPEHVDPDDLASYVGQDLEWWGSMRTDLSIQIFSKFNPLKICAPVIVEEFAKLAHRLNFMYIFPLIEGNKRVRLTQFMSTYSTGGALRDAGYESGDESYHQLDPYFPFDPYQLPVSKRWLEGDYLHWRALPGMDDDSDDDSDDLDDDEVGTFEEQTATDSEGEEDD
ncbi:hypothetical protein N3K66_002488 [Trichothecium roseum]|uniref:Uncharacterized protein n=1 Tax=Trichothecium roseum TaxID=47278 RepID=A0ACC0V9Q3_9HYPO|nr:hypothetical protein N3K66_002488 [Trichothecium roseum]